MPLGTTWLASSWLPEDNALDRHVLTAAWWLSLQILMVQTKQGKGLSPHLYSLPISFALLSLRSDSTPLFIETWSSLEASLSMTPSQDEHGLLPARVNAFLLLGLVLFWQLQHLQFLILGRSQTMRPDIYTRWCIQFDSFGMTLVSVSRASTRLKF